MLPSLDRFEVDLQQSWFFERLSQKLFQFRQLVQTGLASDEAEHDNVGGLDAAGLGGQLSRWQSEDLKGPRVGPS